MKCLLVASPGFVKDGFLQYLKEQGQKQDLKVGGSGLVCFGGLVWFGLVVGLLWLLSRRLLWWVVGFGWLVGLVDWLVSVGWLVGYLVLFCSDVLVGWLVVGLRLFVCLGWFFLLIGFGHGLGLGLGFGLVCLDRLSVCLSVCLSASLMSGDTVPFPQISLFTPNPESQSRVVKSPNS